MADEKAASIMRYPRKGEVQISEVANGIIDPVLARRAGISTALLGSWDEIAGEDFADCTRPERSPGRDATRAPVQAAAIRRAC
jgi:hypothetical protein